MTNKAPEALTDNNMSGQLRLQGPLADHISPGLEDSGTEILIKYNKAGFSTNMGISDSLAYGRQPVSLGPPTFMRYPLPARNTILLRVSDGLLFTVTSSINAGFINSGRLTDTFSVTKPN